MNAKQTLMTLAVVSAMATSAAMAQSTAPAATPSEQGKAGHEQKFEDRKAKALERLAKRADEIQKKQACVQAATDGKALKACFPNRGKHGERDKDHAEKK